MKLLKERDQVRTVAADWRGQYGAGSYDFDTRKRMVGDELAALNAETATAVEVAEIVGHGSWVEKKTCDECDAKTWDAVEVGQPPDYDSSTATICKNCLTAALRLLGDAAAQPVQPAAPQNIREGAPYDNPAFESLCREHGVWGTAASALCAVFWNAAMKPAPKEPK